jgi:16S rRNA (guanine(1405)-N(7))-methyltransferase
MEPDAKEIIESIASSKKYKALYLKTIERVVKDCLKKYPAKECEKRARDLLHQIWGAYFLTRPDFKKLSAELEKNLKIGGDPVSAELNSQRVRKTVLPILQLQSSIKERIPILDDFYRKIFAITGPPKTIVDWACGLNPLSWPWMNLPENCRYLGFDIDKDQNDFLNNVFKIAGKNNFKTKLGDILTDKSPQADVVFLFKILPLLEHQQKGISLDILKRMPAKFLVVSFPTTSIGGRHKGMVDFYYKQFHDLVRNQPWQIEKILFPTELVFIIKKDIYE